MRDCNQGTNLRRLIDGEPVQVLAITSGKGGAGKTNVACNLAITLGTDGRNVCLLDADLSLANVDVLLGLQPRFNLSHVVNGEADLASTALAGPGGIRIIPAASGNFDMTNLAPAAQAGLIQAFSDLGDQPDTLVIDTAAGISPTVARFVQAAQHAIVVVCDEPASLTDAYALIKVFSQNYGITHFHIVTNQSRTRSAGRRLFTKLTKVTDRFLDVVLRHLGDIPADSCLTRAVQEQRAVVDAYPQSPAAVAFRAIAARVGELPARGNASGGIEFFFERLLSGRIPSRGKVA